MTDHIITLPASWQYVDQFKPSQFAPHPSQYRCVAASAAMAAQVAYPGRWNPELLEHTFYQQYAGPDEVSDQQGIGPDALTSWMRSVHIGYIDMGHLINGDMEELRKEMAAQNEQGVLQILSVNDESHLNYAPSGAKLHNWNDAGLSHCFVRIGFSDSDGWGYYAEPAAAGFSYDAKGNWRPVPILWSDVVAGGISSCFAVLPHGMPTPPADFSFQQGAWPPPPVKTDIQAAINTLHAIDASEEQERQARHSAFLTILKDLGVEL